MSVLFIFILGMIFVSSAHSDSLPPVMCEFAGTSAAFENDYTFDIADVPDRCNVLVFGEFDYTVKPNASDSTAITDSMCAGKTVYVVYNRPKTGETGIKEWFEWANIISSADSSRLDTLMAPMLAYLKETNIHGVILDYLGLHKGFTLDYAPKVKKIIDKIKNVVPSIKIGVKIQGYDSYRYNNKRVFDFTVINPIVDFYLIDLFYTGFTDCTKDVTANGGRLPITYIETNVLTLEEVCKDMLSSSLLDQSKIVVNLIDEVYMTDALGDFYYKTYSEYCCRTGSDSDIWCPDTMQLLYNQVKYLKKCSKGMLISYLDADDVSNTCGCGKFPIANTLIDAWEEKPITLCDKIA